MASFYKEISETTDKTTTRTLLHEVIPLTGTIVSGTYSDQNIKTYTHGMFESVFDYPYLSSSANHIFDLTFGYAATSALSGATSTQNSKKINIYNQFSQILVGYDTTGSLRKFTQDGSTTGTEMLDVFIVPFSRLLVKDEIKKGSFSMSLGTGSYLNPFGGLPRIVQDANAATNYKTNSPAGEYGLLYTNSSGTGNIVGHVYYQAGVAVLSASVFNPTSFGVAGATRDTVLSGSSIADISDVFRRRIQNIQLNNTTELNSTIYFCRANFNEFNYSSNPTYVSGSQIVVKTDATSEPISYITGVGLYDNLGNLIAVAKLSEPLKKTPSTELTVRVRLDY